MESYQVKSLISPVTWSSNGSSPKAGMYLAHSTNTSNCCLIESQTSPTVAAFCSDKSTVPTGDVIWMETENQMSLRPNLSFFIAFIFIQKLLQSKLSLGALQRSRAPNMQVAAKTPVNRKKP